MDDLKFNFNAGQSGTKGFSSINPAYYPTAVNPDNDEFRSAYAGGKFEKKLNSDLSIGLRLNIKNSITGYDNSSGATSEINQFKVKTNSTGLFARKEITEKWISNIDISNSNFLYEDLKNGSLVTTTYDSSLGRYHGEQNILRWFNTYEIGKSSVVTFGSDLNRETFGQTINYDLNRNTNGYFAGLSNRYEKWDFQGNLRTDNVKVSNLSSGVLANNATNTNSSLVGVGYQFDDSWRLSSTISSGFRAPNEYEISLSPTLVAEKHTSQEIGVTYIANDNLIRTTYFQSKTKNAITINDDYTAYTNIGEVTNSGMELTARTKLAGNSIKLNAVAQDPWNSTASMALARRARQYGSIDISRPIQGFSFGAKFFVSGQRKNSDYDTVWLGGYSLWSFYGSHDINNELTARVRLENTFNRQYQLAYGYNTPGRGIYATLHYHPKQ